MNKLTVQSYCYMAFFAALTGVLTQISIPLPFTAVPINLAMLAVFLCGGLLPLKQSAMSQGIFLLIGGFGFPVFSNFSGGLGKLFGPTGGYLVGYLVAVMIIGLFLKNKEKIAKNYFISFVLGLAACYFLGTLWYMYVTRTPLFAALIQCVIPFLIGDLLKIILATYLSERLYAVKKFH